MWLLITTTFTSQHVSINSHAPAQFNKLLSLFTSQHVSINSNYKIKKVGY
ncbi:hypothetical protein BACPEC_01864 [[Bacteroides] pectinophilus ATCC 43243]|uniref:Uncharacterized protein n=1 Tax=[Bacteroides] pectinophilus ATCC 43243 TaxID=483218 RepID=B7AS10_9FIRM|nr:hypothetical protein BACPEC_01864 [[Bacteroides] pectinophilus ATCC 43243]